MDFWDQIKRRRMFKVGAAYLSVAWLLTQVASQLEGALNLSSSFDTIVVRLLIFGFPIALILAWVFDLTPKGIQITGKDAAQSDDSYFSGRVLNYLIIGALSLAVVFLVFDNYVLDQTGPEADSSGIAGGGAIAPSSFSEQASVIPNSIAILPFATLGDNENPAGVAEGIYRDIRNELHNLGIALIGLRTMQGYENSALSYSEIAAETRAQYVMDLAVQQGNNSIRVNAELYEVNGSAENLKWTTALAEGFSPEGLLEVRANVARNIAEQVGVELSPAEVARIAEPLTENTEALAYYLRALPYIDDGIEENADNCLEPISQAVALDPEFKEAWYRKAVCHAIRGVVYPNLAQQEQPLAIAASERAIAIDDEYAEAHLQLAFDLGSMGRWRAAGDAYKKARSLGFQSQGSQGPETLFLSAIGHSRAALEAAQRQFDRDPEGAGGGQIATMIRMRLYEVARDMPRSDQTFELGQRLYEQWPTGRFDRLVALMGRARQRQVEPAEVARYFRETFASFSEWHTGLAEIFDDRDAVAANLRERIALGNPFNQLDIAAHAAYVGEPELALEALKNNLSFFALNINLVWSPLFSEVRQLEEFRDYMREIGMVDVWNDLGWPDRCEPAGDDFRCD